MLVAEDLGLFDQVGVVAAGRAAFAADQVLGLVEAVGPRVSERARSPFLVVGVDPLRDALGDGKVVRLGDLEDAVQFAGDPGVTYRHDGPGARDDRRFEPALVQVQCVSGRTSTKTGLAPILAMALALETKVNDGMATSSPGPGSQEHHRQFQERRTGRRHERAMDAEPLLKQLRASPGKFAVARDVPGLDRSGHILQLRTDDVRSIQRMLDSLGAVALSASI